LKLFFFANSIHTIFFIAKIHTTTELASAKWKKNIYMKKKRIKSHDEFKFHLKSKNKCARQVFFVMERQSQKIENLIFLQKISRFSYTFVKKCCFWSESYKKINKEETPSSNGVVWAYFLYCLASKSSCILVFRGFGKKNLLGPACVFIGWLFQAEQFILRSRLLFLFFYNWILNWSNYQLLPMLPRKNFFWNICILL
jgi:hypothetical protein